MNNSQQQGGKDARDGRGPADVRNTHWKVQEDYNTAYAREKEKQQKGG